MAESASGKCFLLFPKAITRGFPCSLYPFSSCRALWADSVSAMRGHSGHRHPAGVLWVLPSDGHSACSSAVRGPSSPTDKLNEHCTWQPTSLLPWYSSSPGKGSWHNKNKKE